MKTIQYELKIIHRKKIALGANDRKEIEKLLEGMLKSEELLNISDSEFAGVLIEEKRERDCPGNCEKCPYLCPKDEDCMIDDLENRCKKCEYGCPECGNCRVINCGVCGDEECENCRWRCLECGGCKHLEGKKQE